MVHSENWRYDTCHDEPEFVCIKIVFCGMASESWLILIQNPISQFLNTLSTIQRTFIRSRRNSCIWNIVNIYLLGWYRISCVGIKLIYISYLLWVSTAVVLQLKIKIKILKKIGKLGPSVLTRYATLCPSHQQSVQLCVLPSTKCVALCSPSSQ